MKRDSKGRFVAERLKNEGGQIILTLDSCFTPTNENRIEEDAKNLAKVLCHKIRGDTADKAMRYCATILGPAFKNSIPNVTTSNLTYLRYE